MPPKSLPRRTFASDSLQKYTPIIRARMAQRIAVVPGDGIGPEVIAAGMTILKRINDQRKLGLEFTHFNWSADEYLRTGVSMPPGAMDDLRRNYAAVSLGAFGDP